MLIRHLPTELKVTIYLSGAQPARARDFADRLVDEGATHLLSFGYAAGLNPVDKPGTLLIPRSVKGPEGITYNTDGDWLAEAAALLHEFYPLAGNHLGVDEPIVEIDQKATVFLRSRGASGVDMESHWLAAVATRRQLPFLAVRVILDAADQSLPPAAMACVRTDGSISMAGLAGSLALRPTQLAALSRLAGAQRKAASSLLGCCRRGGPAGFGVR